MRTYIHHIYIIYESYIHHIYNIRYIALLLYMSFSFSFVPFTFQIQNIHTDCMIVMSVVSVRFRFVVQPVDGHPAWSHIGEAPHQTQPGRARKVPEHTLVC